MNLALCFCWALQQKFRHILRHISTEHAESMRAQSGEDWSKNSATISWLCLLDQPDVLLPCPLFKRMENIRNCLQRRMRTHLPHCKARHQCLHKKFEKTQDKTQSNEKDTLRSLIHNQRPSFQKLEPSLLKLSTSLRLTQAVVTSGMNSFTTVNC